MAGRKEMWGLEAVTGDSPTYKRPCKERKGWGVGRGSLERGIRSQDPEFQHQQHLPDFEEPQHQSIDQLR